MQTVKTIPGKTYAVESAGEVTITNTETGAIAAQGDGSGQVLFTACANSYTVSDDAAKVVALFKSAPGSNVAPGAIAAAQVAAREAKAAADRAEVAAENLEGVAITGKNNTFSGVNTFNGSFVANGPVTLPGAATVNGTSMQDLQEMQAALTVFLEGIGELSLETQLQPMRGCHAKTWNDWAALNPTWAQQKTLIFYAPFAPTGVANMDSNSNVTTNAVKRSLWISPMLPARINTNNALTKALGKDISLYCTASGKLSGVMNIYDAKKVTVITPYATGYESFISNIGFLASSSDNAMHIYAPELQKIVYSGTNTTFYYMPILAEFSIYAPKLTTSFYFSYATNHDTDGDGYVQGQTCAVLQSLIAGIGTAPEPDPNAEPPIEQQTITTQYPQGTDDEIVALEAAAAAKNWQFVYNKTEK